MRNGAPEEKPAAEETRVVSFHRASNVRSMSAVAASARPSSFFSIKRCRIIAMRRSVILLLAATEDVPKALQVIFAAAFHAVGGL
jgi:hypothetical protein